METTSSNGRPRGPRGLRSPQAWHRGYPDRRIAGVCQSLAHNLEISVTAVRLAFVVLTLLHGTGLVLYAILWALLPSQPGEPAALDRLIRAGRRLLEPFFPGHAHDPHGYDDEADYDDAPHPGRRT